MYGTCTFHRRGSLVISVMRSQSPRELDRGSGGSRDIQPAMVSLGQGGDSLGQDPCDDGEGSDGSDHCNDEGDHHMVLLRAETHTPDASRDSGFWWPMSTDADRTNFKVFLRVGEPEKITADNLNLPRGARFVNLSDSIANVGNLNGQLSSDEDGQTLLIEPEREGDHSVQVKVQLPSGACESNTIVFQITKPMQYREPHARAAKPGGTVVFELEEQGANVKLSRAQMGQFSLLLLDSENSVVIKDWLVLNNVSGELKVQLPQSIGNLDKSQTFVVQRATKFRVMEEINFTLNFVTFSFEDCPSELIQGQAISAISLVSTPDIGDLTKLGVKLDIGTLASYGFCHSFSADNSKLQIAGTPNRALDAREHLVKIVCRGVTSLIKLKLPEVEIPKPPCLVPNAVPYIKKFSLDNKLAEINSKVAGADYEFEENISDHKKLLKLGSKGNYYELTLLIGLETEVQFDFDRNKLCSLESIDYKRHRHDPMKAENEQWLEWKPNEHQADFDIKVSEDGHLLITGSPKAHWCDKDVRIDKESGLRFRHYFLRITPQNKAGYGEPVNVLIQCRPLKVFWGLAQTYKFPEMENITTKLECCKADLDTMIKDHRELGFDILLSCCDVIAASIDESREHVQSLLSVVKTVDLSCYISGHGFELEQSDNTWLLVRDKDFSVDFRAERNNLCIQDTVEKISKEADNSSFLVLTSDACREKLKASNGLPPKFGPKNISNSKLRMRISKLFKQSVIWHSTSSGRLSFGGRVSEMSRFTEVLHHEFLALIAGDQTELHKKAGSPFPTGIDPHLEARVQTKVQARVLQNFTDKTVDDDAQWPECQKKALEAFTFSLPHFPFVPPALYAPQQDSNANVVQVPSDADPR